MDVVECFHGNRSGIKCQIGSDDTRYCIAVLYLQESLRKVLQEKLDAVRKLSELEVRHFNLNHACLESDLCICVHLN